MKLSYLLLERKLVLIYWMINILQSLISLIQSQIHQLVIKFQYRLKYVLIIDINGEEPITAQGDLNELNLHKNPCGKSKVKISICRRKIYQRTDLADIFSRFDQVRPVVSNIEFRLLEKNYTPKNTDEGLKGLPIKLQK